MFLCFKPLEADLNRKSFINPEKIVLKLDGKMNHFIFCLPCVCVCVCVLDDPATEGAAVVLLSRCAERATGATEQELPIAGGRYGDQSRDVTGGCTRTKTSETLDAHSPQRAGSSSETSGQSMTPSQNRSI